ncbi:MAG: hypothetical protein O3C40_23815 [Planctomycetota bacterium]|nr:hypothetical protein [Planctomycetota bacterium]
MDGPLNSMDRLYELYQQNFLRLRSSVIEANRSHGSQHPEKTWMELISKEEFNELLTKPMDPKVAKRWIKRIVRGHEEEFPELLVA